MFKKNKRFLADATIIVGLLIFAGWILHTNLAGPRESPSERCFYAASASMYAPGARWRSLSECQGLKDWQLLDVRARIDRTRSR